MLWTVIEHAGRPVAAGPSALLAAPGGTIGRSPDNHLVLPDEQRQISRLQATVRFDDDGRSFVEVSSPRLYDLIRDTGDKPHELYVEPDRPGGGVYGFQFADACVATKLP